MENFGEFGKTGAICQSFTCQYLYYIAKTLSRLQLLRNSMGKMCSMLILKYFHPVKQKPNFPDPSGPVSQTVPPTVIATVNVKAIKALKHKQCLILCPAYIQHHFSANKVSVLPMFSPPNFYQIKFSLLPFCSTIWYEVYCYRIIISSP